MEDKKRFLKGALCGALATLLVAALIVGVWKLLPVEGSGSTYKDDSVYADTESKTDAIQSLVEEYYLYGDKIDEKKMENGIYTGYVNALEDPYSIYYDEAATKDLMDSTTGKYSGIGAVLTKDYSTNAVVIVQVYKDSPAEEAGMKDGDILYQVDDHAVTDEDLTEIVSWIKGEEGTNVKLHVYRGEKLEEQELTATRRLIEVKTVEYEMKENKTGYLRITEFDNVTYDQYMAAMTDLESQGMEGLIIDLRNNPGGNLDSVCKILDEMLPEGLIVYTENKNGKRGEYSSDEEKQFKKPLTVLANQYSASAAEIFCGAIQDYGLGEIVGTTTYGKGVVQQLLDLGDGTCLKVTIAEYFTPKGRSINEKGVTPDVEVVYEANPEDEKADNQLDKASELIQDKMK